MLGRVLRHFAQDGDGNLSAAEVIQALTSHGDKLTPAEVASFLSPCNPDLDGKVSAAKLQSYWSSKVEGGSGTAVGMSEQLDERVSTNSGMLKVAPIFAKVRYVEHHFI